MKNVDERAAFFLKTSVWGTMWRPLNVGNQAIPKRSEENVEEKAAFAGKHEPLRQRSSGKLVKPGLTGLSAVPGLKDSEIRPLDVARRLKAGENDSAVLKIPTQKSFTVFTEKDDPTNENFATSLSPSKRSGSPELVLLSPKRSKSATSYDRTQIEYAPPREEELSMIPDFDLDLTAFDYRVDAGAYNATSATAIRNIPEGKVSIRSHEQLVYNQISGENDVQIVGPMQKLAESSSSVALDDITESLSDVEYGPPREQELPFQPDLNIDMSLFSHIANSNAYYFARHLEEEPKALEFEMDSIETDAVQTISDDTLGMYLELYLHFEIYFSSSDVYLSDGADDYETLIPFSDHYYDINNIVDCCN
ncbi:hypothetical protein DFQ29_000669 [Apophysomyces sp. BC1021]|nr:hypothetical protein DFQ29_000669 [Apophysomyces sp. BC1021]